MEEYMYISLPLIRFKKRYSAPLPKHMRTSPLIENILKVSSMKEFAKLWYRDLSGVGMTTDKYNGSRYRGLNLHSRFLHGTIEFRYFPSKIHHSYMMNWLHFCLAVVHSSKKELNKEFKSPYSIKLEDCLGMVGEERLYDFFSYEKGAYQEQHKGLEVQEYFNITQ